jgi:FtsH-binding integral membrane protein
MQEYFSSPQNIGFSREKSATFLSAVWAYFGLAIAMSALGAWAAPLYIDLANPLFFWGVIIAHAGLMLMGHIWAHKKEIAVPLFFVFAFLSGTVLYPLLAFAALTGQIMAIFNALVATASLFFAAAVVGYTTKKDLSGMGQFLFFAMIGLIVVSIMNIFFFSGIVSTILSVVTVIVFSGFVSYDMQNIKNGVYSSPIYAALHLFISLFAIFQNLLSLFLSNRD